MSTFDIVALIVAFVAVFALIGVFFVSVYNGSFEKMVYNVVDFFDSFKK
jgi:uncharacterized membrane protein